MKRTFVISVSILTLFSSALLANAATTTVQFSFTGAIASWTVPAGVTSILLSTVGAPGGSSTIANVVPGFGWGGGSTGTLAVSSGQIFWYCVGGRGAEGDVAATGTGGFCGGGNAGQGPSGWGGGGGGMSWWGTTSTFKASNILQVGAGGGGSDNADASTSHDADGGGLVGNNAGDVQTQCTTTGQGGTQTAGGRAGVGAGGTGTAGTAGQGGKGAGTGAGRGGGGGAAGWFGGGGGCAGTTGRAQGGSGGSSFASSTASLTVTSTAIGVNSSTQGTITISYTAAAAGSSTKPIRRNIIFVH